MQRSLDSDAGWNEFGCGSFVNQPILTYSNEIRSEVLFIYREKARSYYFSRDAYANMIKDSKYADNKELMIIPDMVHTDLFGDTGSLQRLLSPFFGDREASPCRQFAKYIDICQKSTYAEIDRFL